MSAPTDDPQDPVLTAVTEGLVALHERYYGRRPRRASSRWMGEDLLACLMGDVYTDVEKTMIEMQRAANVRETRSAFQDATRARFIAVAEEATGRSVVNFLSTFHVGPDLELEMFFFDPPA